MVFSEYNKTILPNGLTVVSEKIPTVRSVSIGVWVKSGTRSETKSQNGIAHFLEHLLFKGTEKRSARQIARSLESVGGYLNAFTSKEYSCYYGEVLDDQLPLAVDVLSDMICHSTFPPKEITKEREVILDEIDSVEDTPDDLVQDIFVEKLYPENSLGFPILGTKESVRQLNRDDILEFYSGTYQAGNMVVAAAGNLNHARLVELCESHFSDLNNRETKNNLVPPAFTGHGFYEMKRPINQAHICLGTTALPYNHHRKYELLVFNTLLGGGMGSRLFQNIRERYGLAYSIYSYIDFFVDNGLFAIYLGTEKKKKERALHLLNKELQRLKEKPISKRELSQVKSQLKGNLMLGLESTSRRMSRIAKMEIYLQRFQDIDRVVDEIDKVSREGIHEISNLLFDDDKMLSVVFSPK